MKTLKRKFKLLLATGTGDKATTNNGFRAVVVNEMLSEEVTSSDKWRKSNGFRMNSLDKDRFYWKGDVKCSEVEVELETSVLTNAMSNGVTGFSFEHLSTGVSNFMEVTDPVRKKAVFDWVMDNQSKLVEGFALSDFME